MQRIILLLSFTIFLAFSASAQSVGQPEMGTVDFAWEPSQDEDVGAFLTFPGSPAYAPGLNSGARSIAGPVDLDNDGKMEVVLSDYSSGGRAHVIENVGVDTWELIYSSPTLDASVGSANNARGVGAGDLDGDGFGEIYLFIGNDLTANSPALAFIPGPRLGALEADGDNSFSLTRIALWNFEGIEVDRFRTERMIIQDVDGDGIDELLFANNGSANEHDNWYIVTVQDIGTGLETWNIEARWSSRSSEEFDPVDCGGGSPYGILPADLDGDGSYELVLTSWNLHNFSNVDISGANTYMSPSGEHAYARATETDLVALFGCTAVDMDGNNDDEVYCPIQNTGSVVLLNYEEGENPLEIRFTRDSASDEFSLNNIVSPIIEDAIGWGITSGDIDGDGSPELIGTGPGYSVDDFETGSPPKWVTIVDYNNANDGGVEDPSSYKVRYIEFSTPTETLFNTVNLDSAGVMTTYYEGEGGAAHQFVYLGDVDGDGANEVAMSFQAVPDSIFMINELFNPADSTFSRDTTAAVPNPRRAFLRVLSGDGISTRISEERVIVPRDFELHPNYPNPFNPSTTFSFTLPLDKRVSVKVYDMTGRLIRTLINDEQFAKGTHSVNWNGLTESGMSVASGQYLYTLEWGQFRHARRMVLLK